MYDVKEPKTIRSMFGSIAKNYDRTNAVISFGLYKVWNRKLIDAIEKKQPLKILDLCAGTGDIAFGFLKRNGEAFAYLLDFCPEMLEIATQKGVDFATRFDTIEANAEVIPLPDRSVEAVSIAYGIRNVSNPALCFMEAYRVLKEDGVFAILELTRPANPLLHMTHKVYLKTLLPLLGKVISKNKDAYNYLSNSIGCFSSPEELKRALSSAGFKNVSSRPLTGGSVTLFIAEK